MDIQKYQLLSVEDLKAKIRSLSRATRDEEIRQFGGQYALLCQRLESLYTPDRLDRFIAIRPGGLDEIDKAIALTEPAKVKELTLLKSFRELNRILLPFMDVYEEQSLADLKYMSKEELEDLQANVSTYQTSSLEQQTRNPTDYRSAQNATGTLRLTTLMKEAIRRELSERFGADPA